MPRLPMPMPPSTIRSLGGAALSLPNAAPGMNYGIVSTALAPAAVFKNRRRVRADVLFDMVRLLLVELKTV